MVFSEMLVQATKILPQKIFVPVHSPAAKAFANIVYI